MGSLSDEGSRCNKRLWESNGHLQRTLILIGVEGLEGGLEKHNPSSNFMAIMAQMAQMAQMAIKTMTMLMYTIQREKT